MAERLGPPSEGAGQVDPLKRAVERFERQASSKRFDAAALQRSLDRVRTIGTRLGKSPGELYAELAALSGVAVDLAGKQGSEDAQQSFAEQQQVYQQTSEQLSEGGIILPTSPSQPQRTTGRASG